MSEVLEQRGSQRLHGWVADLGWVIGFFLIAGVVAGLVWWKVVTPAYYLRTSDSAVMLQGQLGMRIKADGWFFTIGVVAGGLGGLGLLRWRDRDPLRTLLFGVVASVVGGIVALRLGEALGKSDVTARVRSAEVLAHVPDSLRVISDWVLIAWPLGFLTAALVVLLATLPHEDR